MYEIFMLSVQLVLLNLLIAIMSDTYERVSGEARLVAHFERAKLMLEEEEKLLRSRSLDNDGEQGGHANGTAADKAGGRRGFGLRRVSLRLQRATLWVGRCAAASP